MQTFLAYMDLEPSVRCLDRNRLNKQRTETLEILVILDGEQPDWMSDRWYARCLNHRNHPAVRMWDGHTEALIEYGVAACDEWTERGYRDNLRDRIVNQTWGKEVILPPWLGDQRLHDGYRSNLLRKNPDWYKQFNWNVPNDLPYYWPV